MRSVALAIFICFSLTVHAQTPLFGNWVAVFQKLDTVKDHALFLELHEDGTTLKRHFHTLGYRGDLSGSFKNVHSVLSAR